MQKTEKLSSAEKLQIKNLMREDGWEAVVKFFAIKISRWNEEKISGTTAFEALRNLHTREGKVEGLEEFMDQLERQAFE